MVSSRSPGGEENSKKYTKGELETIINNQVLEKLKFFKEKGVVNFSKNLLKRKENLDKVKKNLQKKKEEIGLATKELDKKIKEFNELQKKFIGCVDNIAKGQKKRIDHLVEIVGGMRPATAAGVLSVQDSDISIEILGRLPASRVSKIFNSMDKEISARLQKQYINMKK